MTAAIYLRVSTEEQKERQSIETQREFAKRWCELNSIANSEFYADEGISGTVPLEDRPAGRRLLRDAKNGLFKTVLVYKLDRLSRSPRQTLNSVEELKQHGVQIRSMTEHFDTEIPSGRLMLTMLSGMAGYERDTIIERSIEGTNRLARAGTWLGGIVPFGYRVEGQKKDARLVVSDEPIDGTALSEADVVRMIYRMSAEQGKSCVVIAQHLSALGIPPAYTRDGRKLLRGKRKQTTAGIWRPGRIRNLIKNTTYKGLHEYGKRSKKKREIIRREVPALVGEDTWERAQATLKANFLFGVRNATSKYLLRGIIKCGMCGLTYIGTRRHRRNGRIDVYYNCNGKQQARGFFGNLHEKCPSKAVKGDIEDIVWNDIEGFIRNPGSVLHRLAEKLQEETGDCRDRGQELQKLKETLEGKEAERRAVLGLFRRGRIDEATLDQQLDDIEAEKTHFERMVADLEQPLTRSGDAEATLCDAEDLLRELHARLEQPITWETKRQLVELLVVGITVRTDLVDGRKEAAAEVVYRFGAPQSPVEGAHWLVSEKHSIEGDRRGPAITSGAAILLSEHAHKTQGPDCTAAWPLETTII